MPFVKHDLCMDWTLAPMTFGGIFGYNVRTVRGDMGDEDISIGIGVYAPWTRELSQLDFVLCALWALRPRDTWCMKA